MTRFCRVTTWTATDPTPNSRGIRVMKTGRCGEPVERDGLCTFHLSEKERLSR